MMSVHCRPTVSSLSFSAMQIGPIACSVAFVACSSVLTGCGSDSPSPGGGGVPTTTTTQPPTTTTTQLTCQPGNELDQCKSKCTYCHQAHECEILGSVGCGGSSCGWLSDDNKDGGHCQSPHATTTPATTPAGECMPHTATDACFTRGAYAHSEQACNTLGPIGCYGQVCHYFDKGDGTMACGSRHATTTEGPCEPGTITDACFTTCQGYCTDATSCEQLGSQGCGRAACAWKDNHCESSSAAEELIV